MEKNGALWLEHEFINDSGGGVVLFLILYLLFIYHAIIYHI